MSGECLLLLREFQRPINKLRNQSSARDQNFRLFQVTVIDDAFNFCRPNSSLYFIDSHEKDTKQQEKFHKSQLKNYEDSSETRTLGFKKVD